MLPFDAKLSYNGCHTTHICKLLSSFLNIWAPIATMTPDTWAEKFESFQRINSICETNGNFDSCNPCKQLVSSRLHGLHESKFPFVSRIEFIRWKLSNFSAHVSGVTITGRPTTAIAITWPPPTVHRAPRSEPPPVQQIARWSSPFNSTSPN